MSTTDTPVHRLEQHWLAQQRDAPTLEKWQQAYKIQKELFEVAKRCSDAIKTYPELIPAAVAAASPEACRLAYLMNRAGNVNWKPEDVAPPSDGTGGAQTVLSYASVVLPILVLTGSLFFAQSWLLLVAPVALAAWHGLRYLANDLRQHRAEKAIDTTHNLYAMVQQLRSELKMDYATSVTPFFVSDLAARYVADTHAANLAAKEKAAAEAAERTLAAAAKAEANRIWQTVQATAAASAAAAGCAYAGSQTSSNATYANSDDNHYDSTPAYTPPTYDDSYYSEPDYGYPDTNVNGLPMIHGTPLDVCGNVYGTSDW